VGMRAEITTQYGPRGQGETRVTKTGVKIIAADGTVYGPIAREDVAEGVWLPTRSKSDVCFRLSYDETRIYYLGPWHGLYPARFFGFPRRDDQPPKYYHKEGGERRTRDGRRYYESNRLLFTAIFEITTGDMKGAHPAKTYDYLFEPDEDGLAKIVGTGKRGRRLVEFMRLCGFDFQGDSVEFTNNILPALEKILLDKKAQFMLQFEDGWINELLDLPEGMALK